MEETYSKVTASILQVASPRAPQRILVGIAGPPGSGKTTLAAHVMTRLNVIPNGPMKSAICVSTDGFHYTRSQLDKMEDPQKAHKRRGAPFTFDVEAILGLVQKLHESTLIPAEDRVDIIAPSFDHTIKDPVADGTIIPAAASIVILEGNYLLLNEGPWARISPMLDFRVLVSVSSNEARNRVSLRHVRSGIEPDLQRGQQRFDSNDAINGDLIRAKLMPCDLVVESVTA